MKEKLQYSIVLIAILTGAYLSLSQVSDASLFPTDGKKLISVDFDDAPSDVRPLIDRLHAKYPHLNESCIYGSAMVMKDQANEVGDLLEIEGKCIHTMVIEESKTIEEARRKLAFNTKD